MSGADGADRSGSNNLPALQTVGYRQPPAEHRFKKRLSGNPRGRPPGSKKKGPEPLDAGHLPTSRMILEEAYRPVSIREGDEILEIPAIQAVMRAMGVAAIKGNRLSQKLIAEMVQRVEAAERAHRTETLEAMLIYKTRWEDEFERCKRMGLPEPTQLPHPDDVILDFRKGTVRIAGPATKEEKADFDERIARRDDAQEEVDYAHGKFQKARDPRMREFLLCDWHCEQRIFDMINDSLPKRYRVDLRNRSYREGASRAGTALKEYVEDRKRPKTKRKWS